MMPKKNKMYVCIILIIHDIKFNCVVFFRWLCLTVMWLLMNTQFDRLIKIEMEIFQQKETRMIHTSQPQE